MATIGTTYYKLTPDFVEDEIRNDKFSNLILLESFLLFGWDAFDMDYLEDSGSLIIGDNLYLCITDGKDIYVDGVSVDPFDALQDFDLDELDEYIKDGDDPSLKLVHRYLTTDELNPDMDIEAVVESLLQNYRFVDILEDANDVFFLKKDR